ncbi:MAG: hypothetical protein BWK80_57160 [Desulfobacteraceae bacterium IS3]|nr:MAG: hypothetical protein BWK80_57160 [Desulfobacteraceae bacterium IS3]
MRRIIFAVIVMLLISASFANAAGGKSGVSPQVISLPRGPASIEGLGESFEPQLNTGTAAYSIPLNLPKIRGTSPGLVLEYNSGYGNGAIGMGWRLNIPFIQRQTDKGLPLYNDADTFIESGGEELVSVDSQGTYRCKNESSFIEYRKLAHGRLG